MKINKTLLWSLEQIKKSADLKSQGQFARLRSECGRICWYVTSNDPLHNDGSLKALDFSLLTALEKSRSFEQLSRRLELVINAAKGDWRKPSPSIPTKPAKTEGAVRQFFNWLSS